MKSHAFDRSVAHGTRRLACILAVTAIAMSPAGSAQQDQDTVSSNEIEQALKKPKTRGIGIRRNAKVDLDIPFEINSSELRPDASAQLEQLELALQKESLANSRIQLAGHTDASGSAAYNRQLARDRAESVKRFLVQRGVDAERLEVVGSGADELLFPEDPLHAGNRRVEIRNLGEYK